MFLRYTAKPYLQTTNFSFSNNQIKNKKIFTFNSNIENRQVYPTLTGSKTPPQNSAKAKNLGGNRAVHKSPIGED